MFLLVPVILVVLSISRANVNIGVRHILPVYPSVCSRLARSNSSLRSAAVGRRSSKPLVLTAMTSLRIAPHQIAYFNEIGAALYQGHPYSRSSPYLPWGQDLKGVKAYMDKERLPIIYLSYFGSAPPSCHQIATNTSPALGRSNGCCWAKKFQWGRNVKILAL